MAAKAAMGARPSCWVLRECGRASCAAKLFDDREDAAAAYTWYLSLQKSIGRQALVPVVAQVASLVGLHHDDPALAHLTRGDERALVSRAASLVGLHHDEPALAHLTRGDVRALASACGLNSDSDSGSGSGADFPAIIFRDEAIAGGGHSFGDAFFGGPGGSPSFYRPSFALVATVGQVLLNAVARLAAKGAPHLGLDAHHVTATGRVLDVQPNPADRLKTLRTSIAAAAGDAPLVDGPTWDTVPVDFWVAKLFAEAAAHPDLADAGLALPALKDHAPRWAKARTSLYSRLARVFAQDRYKDCWQQMAAKQRASADMAPLTAMAAVLTTAHARFEAGLAGNSEALDKVGRALARVDAAYLVGRGIKDPFEQDRVLVMTAHHPTNGYAALVDELEMARSDADRFMILNETNLATAGPWGFAATCAASLSPLRLAGVTAEADLASDPPLEAMVEAVARPVAAMAESAALQTLLMLVSFQVAGTPSVDATCDAVLQTACGSYDLHGALRLVTRALLQCTSEAMMLAHPRALAALTDVVLRLQQVFGCPSALWPSCEDFARGWHSGSLRNVRAEVAAAAGASSAPALEDGVRG